MGWVRADADTLPSVLARGREADLGLLLVGGGSNMLVADAGFPGLAVSLRDDGLETQSEGDQVQVRAGAGMEWDALVSWATQQDLAGIECLSGIPGRVGAAPMQNIGAYGQEIGESLVAVHAVDRITGETHRIPAQECELGYRTSRFKHREANRWIVTSVTLALTRGGAPALRYAELTRAARELPELTLPAVRELVLRIRARKSMVLDPSDPDARSAGSFFTNPIVSEAVAEDVRALARARGVDAEVPSWPGPNGSKLAAGWLIERAGFARGWGEGPAGLSSKHTLAIVNRGGATAANVVDVAATVRRGVRDAFGIILIPEPVFVGFEAGPDPSAVLDAAESDL